MNSSTQDIMNQLQAYSQGSAAFSSVGNIISFIMSVLAIIGMWMVFNKASDHGWAAIIPFYRDYVLCRVARRKNLFWPYLICQLVTFISSIIFFISFFTFFLSIIGTAMTFDADSILTGSSFGIVLSFITLAVASIAAFVIRIFIYIGLTKSFGLNGGWVVGLIFLSGVFFMIMGASDNIRYIGDGSGGYSQSYGQPYGQSYSQSYGQPYGQSYDPSNGQPYGQDAQNVYGPQGNPSQQGNPYQQGNQSQPGNDSSNPYQN